MLWLHTKMVKRHTCRLLVIKDRNLIDLYVFKHFKCAGVKCLQNEHFSCLFTKFDHFSQHRKVVSFRFGFFCLMVFQITLISSNPKFKHQLPHVFNPSFLTWLIQWTSYFSACNPHIITLQIILTFTFHDLVHFYVYWYMLLLITRVIVCTIRNIFYRVYNLIFWVQ